MTAVFLAINEHSSAALLKAVLSHVRGALNEVGDFWRRDPASEQPIDYVKLQSQVESMLQPETKEQLEQANTLFRNLVKCQLLIGILSELHAIDSYMSRQPSQQMLATLRSSEEVKTIHELCALQRAAVLSVVRLKASTPNSARPAVKPEAATKATQSAEVGSATGETQAEDEAAVASEAPMAGSEATGTVLEPEKPSQPWPESKNKNAKALKQVLTSIPDSMRLFLQGVMSLQVGRRSLVDATQRRDATFVAHAIATGIAQNLRWPDTRQSPFGRVRISDD